MTRRKVTSQRAALPEADEDRRAREAERIERGFDSADYPQANRARADHASLRHLIEAIRAERQQQQLSLKDLSQRTGIDKANLSRLENDARARPTLETLQRLAEALGKQVRFDLEDKAA
jgi:DNA-binding Xre family transcriptional regulator